MSAYHAINLVIFTYQGFLACIFFLKLELLVIFVLQISTQSIMFVRKKCPPYCSNYCQEQHHKLIVSLLNVQENDRKSLEKFKKRVSFYYDSLQPKDPIPDPVKEYRYPLMHWAGVLGKISAVEHLIERGHPTDIQSAGKSEGTMHRVVHCLAGTMKNYKLEQIIKRFKGLTDILSDALFIADDNGNTPLHSCAVYITELDNEPLLSFYKRALEIMIDKVIDIGDRDSALTDILNIQNKEGNTILHILSCKQEGCPEIATQLLKEGVNLNLRNSDGKTAFEIASESSRKMAKVIHLYQRRKAKLEQQVEPSVSSSAADMSSPASSCGHHKKPASNEHSLVSSTSKEDLNTLHERSVSKEDDVIFMSSDPGQGGKRRKIAPKKEDIKPTLIKTSEEYTPHLSTTHMDTTTTSDCNTVFDGTEPRGRTQSRENNPSSSPRMEFGKILSTANI